MLVVLIIFLCRVFSESGDAHRILVSAATNTAVDSV